MVAQLNRGAYGNTQGPDVSHLAGTSELERFASAVWLLERPKTPEGVRPARGVLEVHHGKFRHGQQHESELNRSLIRIDRAHCFLEADQARKAYVGADLYPGVEAEVSAIDAGGYRSPWPATAHQLTADENAEDGEGIRATPHRPRR